MGNIEIKITHNGETLANSSCTQTAGWFYDSESEAGSLFAVGMFSADAELEFITSLIDKLVNSTPKQAARELLIREILLYCYDKYTEQHMLTDIESEIETLRGVNDDR